MIISIIINTMHFKIINRSTLWEKQISILLILHNTIHLQNADLLLGRVEKKAIFIFKKK